MFSFVPFQKGRIIVNRKGQYVKDLGSIEIAMPFYQRVTFVKKDLNIRYSEESSEDGVVIVTKDKNENKVKIIVIFDNPICYASNFDAYLITRKWGNLTRRFEKKVYETTKKKIMAFVKERKYLSKQMLNLFMNTEVKKELDKYFIRFSGTKVRIFYL